MLKHLTQILLIPIVIFTSCSEKESEADVLTSGNQISYNFHIRPILSDNCFACHGPDENKRESGLRLDTEESAYAALKENPEAHAIVPGKPGKSEVVLRIEATDAAELMPPPESNLKLSGSEIETIKKWIKQGAKYQPHWAFVTPSKTSLPKNFKC
ncbi:hypothetical protein ADICYQ_4271 [Cyclobacterium qasimii M12-11B]|uniref:Cytochrome c domain-containing protein n=1 Tax=Cyclobacterium qasimii M12-11B TaxID=641524 RepID=S7WIY7_9BACT|nr:hypothetical protein ADICYQ_4271 [Cyclobacterium qasimii M12-11B]